MALFHYKIAATTRLDSIDPFSPFPVNLFDIDGARTPTDVLQRFIWWPRLYMNFESDDNIHQQSAVESCITLGWTWNADGVNPPGRDPFTSRPEIFARTSLFPTWINRATQPTTGALTAWTTLYQGPVEGISTEGQRKGSGLGGNPTFSFHIRALDPTGELYTSDTHRSSKLWISYIAFMGSTSSS